MEKSEIDAVRASIIDEYTPLIDEHTAQIAELNERMNAELVLLAKIEQRLAAVTGKQKSRRTLPPGFQPEAKPPLGKERIRAAKNKISGRFSRKTLHEAVNNDGYGEMKIGTFSPYISEMIGTEIIEVQKALGSEPAVYMWAEEHEKLKAELPAKAVFDDLF